MDVSKETRPRMKLLLESETVKTTLSNQPVSFEKTREPSIALSLMATICYLCVQSATVSIDGLHEGIDLHTTLPR